MDRTLGGLRPKLPSRRGCLKTLALVAGPGLACRRVTSPPSLWFGGDLHLGDQLAPVSPFLKGLPGSGIVNLEGPIASGPGWQKGSSAQSVILRNHPDAGTWLGEHQIAAVTTLNNHCDDLGPAIEQESQAALRRGPSKLLFPAHNLVDMAGPWSAAAAYLGAKTNTGVSQADLDAISSARSKGRLVAVTVHIDGPPSYLPSPQVRAQVLRLAKAGAAVIALHGSHVIGPIERYGQCLIAWGLGNLSFACPCSKEQDGLVLQVQANSAKALRARIFPIRVGNATTPVAAHPQPDSMFELLSALESCPMRVQGGSALL